MNFIIYICRPYPPVVIVCGTDWVQEGLLWAPESLGKKIKIFLSFLKHCYECKHVTLLWCDTRTFRKYIALIDPLSKTLKIFEFQKSRFFQQSWEYRFLFKTKSPNKKRSVDLKSALNSTFNYVLHYIWPWLGCGVRSIL